MTSLKTRENKIRNVYKLLLKKYGKQGWWPITDLEEVKYTKDNKNYGGYHPGNYEFPKTREQKYEICIGAILTQNVGWKNVEKALKNLKEIKCLKPETMARTEDEKINIAIKPTGYYNQKTRKIKEFTRFFIELNNKKPTREELLNIWGVGKETADSMLLYAFKEPVFVIDTYTKRILSELRIISKEAKYDKIKELFEKSIEQDLATYQEYHALIVEHAKRTYLKKNNSKKQVPCV